MTRARRLLGCAMVGALVLGADGADPASGQDPGTETLTIYGAVCPVDYEGEQFFADCFATPAAGASYQVRNTQTGEMRPPTGGFAAADAAGFVAFEDLSGLAPGTIQILAMAADEVAVPGGYTVPAVACTANEERPVAVALLDTGFTGRIVEVEVQAGDDLRCDVYYVPLSLQDSDDQAPPDDETPATEATTAPVPGRPAAVYAGGCPSDEDDPGDVAAELTDLIAPTGEVVGMAAAVVAETSFTTVPRSLDALLAERYAIGVGSLGADEPDLVACGEIGGVLNDAGNVVIGLREVGDSGFTGIAFLAPSAADADRTDVSVFLAAGLAQEETAADSTAIAR